MVYSQHNQIVIWRVRGVFLEFAAKVVLADVAHGGQLFKRKVSHIIAFHIVDDIFIIFRDIGAAGIFHLPKQRAQDIGKFRFDIDFPEFGKSDIGVQQFFDHRVEHDPGVGKGHGSVLFKIPINVIRSRSPDMYV